MLTNSSTQANIVITGPEDLCGLQVATLRGNNLNVRYVQKIRDVYEVLQQMAINAAVLDWRSTTGLDGFWILEALRARRIPVILIIEKGNRAAASVAQSMDCQTISYPLSHNRLLNAVLSQTKRRVIGEGAIKRYAALNPGAMVLNALKHIANSAQSRLAKLSHFPTNESELQSDKSASSLQSWRHDGQHDQPGFHPGGRGRDLVGPVYVDWLFENIRPVVERLAGTNIAVDWKCSKSELQLDAFARCVEHLLLFVATTAFDALHTSGGTLSLSAQSIQMAEVADLDLPVMACGEFVRIRAACARRPSDDNPLLFESSKLSQSLGNLAIRCAAQCNVTSNSRRLVVDLYFARTDLD